MLDLIDPGLNVGVGIGRLERLDFLHQGGDKLVVVLLFFSSFELALQFFQLFLQF